MEAFLDDVVSSCALIKERKKRVEWVFIMRDEGHTNNAFHGNAAFR